MIRKKMRCERMDDFMIKKIALLLISCAVLCGCAQQIKGDDDKITVYASFYAMYDIAREIGGDCANVINMVAPGIEAHDYEPSAMEIAKLGSADLFVYSGSGMEPWVGSVSENIMDKVTVVNTGERINMENIADAHTWLSPELAVIQAQKICDAMIGCDPENEDIYTKNTAEFTAKAEKLQERLDSIAQNAKRAIVVSHKAFGYMGIEQVGIENEQGTGDPSPAKLAEVIDYIKDNDVKYIFTTELEGEGAAKTAADETGAEIETLNTLEGDMQDRDYCTIMEENLDKIEKAVL